MRIGIAQIDGKWPNLALAKLCAWHRERGDEVDWYSPLFGADKVYASQIFTWSDATPYLPADTVMGGTGIDLSIRLSDEIEAMRPDLSLWPMWKHDLGYSTRGCVRSCKFCFVPRKEGRLRVVSAFGDLSTGRSRLVLLDNNITAAPIEHFRDLCHEATAAGVELDFSQGLDARLLTDEHAEIIQRTKRVHHLHIAFDHPRDETHVRQAVGTLIRAGFAVRSRLTAYVLVGFNTTPDEDLHRVNVLRELGVTPYIMIYNHPRGAARTEHARLAAWANCPQQFWSCTFDEFRL